MMAISSNYSGILSLACDQRINKVHQSLGAGLRVVTCSKLLCESGKNSTRIGEELPLMHSWGNEKRNYRSKQAPPSRKVGIKWLNGWLSLPTFVECTNAGIDTMNVDAENPGVIVTRLGNQWRIDATTNLDLHPDYLPETLLGVPSKSRFIQMENYYEACSLAKQLTGALNHE